MLDSGTRPRPALHTLLVLVLVQTTALVLATLWWIGDRTTDQVSAATGKPRCEGTQPTTVVEDDGAGFERAAIPLTEDFVCTLFLKVSNGSKYPVRLGRVTVPVSGPRGGGGYQITHLGGTVVPDGDQADAVVDLDRSVEPGRGELIEVRTVFRESGCSAEGARERATAHLEVSRLLASRDLVVADLPVFLGTPDSACTH